MRAARLPTAPGGCACTASWRIRFRVPVLTRPCACLYIDWARFSSALTFLPVCAVMKASGMYDIERNECWTIWAYLRIIPEPSVVGSEAIRSHLLTVKMHG